STVCLLVSADTCRLLSMVCGRAVAESATDLVPDLQPAVATAFRRAYSAAADRHASRADKPTRQPSPHPFSHRLRGCVRKYQSSCATCASCTRLDPGPCRCRANRPG